MLWISEACNRTIDARHDQCEDPVDCACPCHEEDEHADHRVAEEQLPDANIPTVTLTLEQLRRFRDSFAWLQQFAADVCGTTPERLCIWDVDKWRYQHGLVPRDPLMRHFAETADRRRRGDLIQQTISAMQAAQRRQGQPPGPAAPPAARLSWWARVLQALARRGHPW